MTQRTKKIVGIMGITLAVYAGMKYLLPAVVPFFIAYLLVRWIYPLASWIAARFPVKKETVTLVILLTGTVFIVALCCFLGGKLCGQIRSIVENLDYYENQINHMAHSCCQAVERIFGVKGEAVMDFLLQNMQQARERVQVYILPDMVQHSMTYVMGILKIVGIFFLIFIGVLLLMRDYDGIREKLEGWRGYEKAAHIMDRLWSLGGAYLKAQFLLMLIVIGICVLGLMLTGNPYALLVGILIGFLDVFPFIGTGTVLIPWALLCLLKKDFFHAAAYFTLFLVANGTREYLEPRFVGNRIGVYPVVIAVVVYAGLWIYGVAGVILGPLTLLIILECVKEFYP